MVCMDSARDMDVARDNGGGVNLICPTQCGHTSEIYANDDKHRSRPSGLLHHEVRHVRRSSSDSRMP
jgi:hypothetical protein